MTDREILVISEGPKEETLIKRLFESFSARPVTVVSFKTNIYQLYKLYDSQGQDFKDLDLVSVLRGDTTRQYTDQEKEALTDSRRYTDIFLVFDLDPHDQGYSTDKILKLMNHFSDSTDAGRLYINYPMVESFWHMAAPVKWTLQTKSEFRHRIFCMANLTGYKKAVNKEGFRFSELLSTADYANVIQAHALKAGSLVGCSPKLIVEQSKLEELLRRQCRQINQSRSGFVVNTSCFLVPELYPKKVIL